MKFNLVQSRLINIFEVIVVLSGGLSSSVAAALLKEPGCDVMAQFGRSVWSCRKGIGINTWHIARGEAL